MLLVTFSFQTCNIESRHNRQDIHSVLCEAKLSAIAVILFETHYYMYFKSCWMPVVDIQWIRHSLVEAVLSNVLELIEYDAWLSRERDWTRILSFTLLLYERNWLQLTIEQNSNDGSGEWIIEVGCPSCFLIWFSFQCLLLSVSLLYDLYIVYR